MQRIDDYLNAVRFFLPRKQKDDILRELAENIRAQVADKEERLGRSLSGEEEDELLKQYGHPMLFALRYRPDAAHLIGPAVFPFYWVALKIALLVTGFGYAVSAVVQLTRGAAVHWLGFFETALPVFGWLTFMFAALDFLILRYGLWERLNARWNPGSLRASAKQEARPETIFNWVARAVCTVWWLVGLRNPVWIFGPGAAFFAFGPGVHQLYPAIFVLAVAGLLVSWRARRMVRMAADGAGLIPFCLLPWAGDFVIAIQPDLSPMARLINLSIWVSAWVSLFIVVLVLAWNGRKYFRRRNAGAVAV